MACVVLEPEGLFPGGGFPDDYYAKVIKSVPIRQVKRELITGTYNDPAKKFVTKGQIVIVDEVVKQIARNDQPKFGIICLDGFSKGFVSSKALQFLEEDDILQERFYLPMWYLKPCKRLDEHVGA